MTEMKKPPPLSLFAELLVIVVNLLCKLYMLVQKLVNFLRILCYSSVSITC